MGCATGKFRTLIFSRNPHFVASNLAGNESCILFISISCCRVFLLQNRKPAQCRYVCCFARDPTFATSRVNPQHTHQQHIINDTSQRPTIISETQHSVNHRKLRFQPCYFMFYLPNKRRRCHPDVARRGRKVYQIYFWRHQPPAFLATPSKASYCSKARKHQNFTTAWFYILVFSELDNQ